MNSTFKSPRSKHIVRTSGQKLKSVVLLNIVRWQSRHAEKNRKSKGTLILRNTPKSRVKAAFVESPQIAGT